MCDVHSCRVKLVLLELVDLRVHKDPVERVVHLDHLDPLVHLWVKLQILWQAKYDLIFFIGVNNIYCILKLNVHILQGNPGTDGIPGAKGSAVSITL